MTKIIDNKICCYCGNLASEMDHLPPKNIFPKPKPTNLITVPSCSKCNQGDSKDDEYFGYVITAGGAKNPIANKLFLTKKIEKIKRRPAIGHAILKDFVTADLFQGNIYIGQTPALRVKGVRFNKVIRRITRGFYYHHTGKNLPFEYDIRVTKINPKLNENQMNVFKYIKLHSIGKDIFQYRYIIDEENTFHSIWFYMFYKELFIIATTEQF